MLNALYCLIGKSGTGKSTVMQALHDTYGYTIARVIQTGQSVPRMSRGMYFSVLLSSMRCRA